MGRDGSPCGSFSAAELLRAARDDDASAWAELVDRYGGVLRSVVAEFRLQPADATDVAQNTWLRLYLHADAIRDPARLPGWLSTTARREALAVVRRSGREVTSDSAGEGVGDASPSPEEIVIIAETCASVRAATDALPDRQRLLVDELFYEPPRSYRDVAQRTGLPVGSIGPTRGRLLRELHRRLGDAEGDLAA
jgi:RNA polymerase sigma factor (sigma-70 family)